MDYTALSLTDVRNVLDEVARDAHATFSVLDARQLNWRPDATRWSVAQCFEHLLTADRLMLRAAQEAVSGAQAANLWRRLPLLPGLFGRMLIRSQSPENARKYTASPKATPATSDIAADIIHRFIDEHREIAAWMRGLDERDAARTIMTSPFLKVITYSVLDGCRLIAAHDRRHVEQAQRVRQSPGFPAHERSV